MDLREGTSTMKRHNRKAAGVALALLMAMTTSGCKNFLNVNHDPNNPQTVPLALELPGMLMAFGHEILGPTESRYSNLLGPAGYGPLWMDQTSVNRDRSTYSQTQWFQVSNQDTDGFWNAGYTDVMNECVNIMNNAGAKDPQYYGIAEFMFAWTAAELTDAFGPIPFDDAFKTTDPTPKYDTQQHVYSEVYTMIDDAIKKMQQTDPNPPSTGDVVYQGDMSAWVKLAYSEKARLEMRLVYAPGESKTGHAQAALTDLASGMQSASDAPTVHYAGGDGARSPWWHYAYADEGDGTGKNRMSEFFIDTLKANNDPRLPILADPTQLQCPAGTTYQRADCTLATTVIYRGHPDGAAGEPDSAISAIGSTLTADNRDFIWFPYADTKFLEAEAQLIVSGAAAAEAPYVAGIRADMTRLGVASSDIDNYVAAVPSLSTVATPLADIMWEKYISNFLRDEVWTDYRRTGYPKVPLPTPPAGQSLYLPAIPQRLRTPAVEENFNSDQVAATGIPFTLDGMMVKVWWASGTP